MIALGRRFDFPGPGDNSRDTYSSFVNKTFSPTILRPERTSTVEPRRIATTIKSRSIIGSKHDNRIVVQTFLLQLLYQLAYLLVKITDHSSISRMRIATRHISGFSDVGGFVSKLPDIILHPFLRCLQRHVR